MAPKKDIVYSRGRSKSMAPLWKMIYTSDDDRDHKYNPLDTQTPITAAAAACGTP